MAWRQATPEDAVRASSRPGEVNTARQLFGDGLKEEAGKLLPAQAAAFAEIKEHRRKVALQKAEGRYNPEQDEIEKYKIEERLYTRQAHALGEIEEQYDKYKKEYFKNRNPNQDLLDLKRWENRYGVMSPEELESEVEQYGQERNWDPDRLDALTFRLSTTDPELAQGLRNMMQKNDYRAPWKRQVPHLRILEELYNAPLGRARVLSPLGGWEEISLDALYE